MAAAPVSAAPGRMMQKPEGDPPDGTTCAVAANCVEYVSHTGQPGAGAAGKPVYCHGEPGWSGNLVPRTAGVLVKNRAPKPFNNGLKRYI